MKQKILLIGLGPHCKRIYIAGFKRFDLSPALIIDKGNGRVRHETLSLQMGPLMNIQVHSYQAYEIKERKNQSIDHQAHGGLEHF